MMEKVEVGTKLMKEVGEGMTLYAMVVEVINPDPFDPLNDTEENNDEPFIVVDFFDDDFGYGITQSDSLSYWTKEWTEDGWTPYDGQVYECVEHGMVASPEARPHRMLTMSPDMIDRVDFFKRLNDPDDVLNDVELPLTTELH